MAERTNLRPIGVIENMSWFVCPHCGEREAIFGEGGGAEAAQTLGVELLGQVPLLPALRQGGDAGTPIVVSDPDSVAGQALRDAARAIARTTRTKVGKPLPLMANPGAPVAAGHHGHAH
jgi:ATP-binding protein involved in chromosome partitioning